MTLLTFGLTQQCCNAVPIGLCLPKLHKWQKEIFQGVVKGLQKSKAQAQTLHRNICQQKTNFCSQWCNIYPPKTHRVPCGCFVSIEVNVWMDTSCGSGSDGAACSTPTKHTLLLFWSDATTIWHDPSFAGQEVGCEENHPWNCQNKKSHIESDLFQLCQRVPPEVNRSQALLVSSRKTRAKTRYWSTKPYRLYHIIYLWRVTLFSIRIV